MEPPQLQPSSSSSSSSSSSWSKILQNQKPSLAEKAQNPSPTMAAAPNTVLVDACNSTSGISVAVIDANAVIQGGEKLHDLADKFVTVPEVLAEIRDPVSRNRLHFIPFTIDSMEPTPEALNKVIKFARATGDLQTLSDVDLKLIALTYTLEAQIHGTSHLRDAPPPVHVVNVKRLPEKDMPGWGSNVPNLAEWEALDRESGDGLNVNSRILPLRDISLNIMHAENDEGEGSEKFVGEKEEVEAKLESHDDVQSGMRRPRRYPPRKTEINMEGKKMVATGVDASQGQFEDEAGEFMPAVSRSTHRRYLRRKARREYNEQLIEKDCQQDLERNRENNDVEETTVSSKLLDGSSEAADAGTGIPEETIEVKTGEEDLSSILKEMRLEEESLKACQEGRADNAASVGLESNNSLDTEESPDCNAANGVEAGEDDDADSELDDREISSETNGTVDASCVDEDGSEQSWMLRSLSESTVACVTGDFAMQNVLLQIGLRLLAPGGMQIRQLQRWILKCHACYTVTAEIDKIFCPKCGNGGTLRKVAVTVGENGITLADRPMRVRLRGTKFSLPLPKGGRDAIAKNLILREDQLPQKFLNPRRKKKMNKEGDDFVAPDFIFSHHTDKKAPFQPPIRKALAVFSGKRNPNDNHYSRPKH